MIEIFGKPKKPQEMYESKLLDCKGNILQKLGKVYFFTNNYMLDYFKIEEEYLRHKILGRNYTGYCKTNIQFGTFLDNKNYIILGYLGTFWWKLKNIYFDKKQLVSNKNACFCKFKFRKFETFRKEKTENLSKKT